MTENKRSKKKNRRAYLNDFKKNSAGEYEYQGAIYEWEGTEAEYKKQKLQLGLIGLAATVGIILPDTLSAPGMLNCAYVILPYIISFVCEFSVMWALIRLLLNGKKLRAYIYEETVLKIPNRVNGTVFASAAAIFGEIIYLQRHGTEGKLWQALAFCALYLIAIGILLLLSKKVLNMKWEKKEREG